MAKSAADWLEYCSAEMQNAGLVFGHGTDNARDEAAWLVLYVLGAPLDGSFAEWSRPVRADEELRLQELLARRIGERVPLAYLTGEAHFCGLEFIVTPDVLVPRSPIAELIEEHFSPWVSFEAGSRVLDLCTGGGCIAIAMASHMQDIFVDAVDLSADALEIARRNTARHGVQDRVRLVQSDLFEALGDERYRLIVSNPPYVSAASHAALPPEYQAEPSCGLVSGVDGLDIVLEILEASPRHLDKHGVLVVEVGESAPALGRLLPRVPFLWLEFSLGGDGVFLLEYDQLLACQDQVRAELERRQDVG